MLQHWEENSSIGVRTYDSPWGQSVLERYPTYFPPQVLFPLLIPRSGADLTFKMFGFTEAAQWRQIGAAVPFTLSQVWLLTAQQKQTLSSFLPPIRRSTARRASPSVVVNTDTIWLQCSNPNIVMWFFNFFFFLAVMAHYLHRRLKLLVCRVPDEGDQMSRNVIRQIVDVWILGRFFFFI